MMEIEFFKNVFDVMLWKFNGVLMRIYYNEFVLFVVNEGNFIFLREWNVVNYYSNLLVWIIVWNCFVGL